MNLAKPRVVYLLAYRDPRYIRTYSLLRALEQIGEIELIPIINRQRNFSRYQESLRELRRVAQTGRVDFLIIGFRGNEIYWPARWIVGRETSIIFDALMSPFGALSEESKHGVLGRLLAKFVFPVEKSILKDADVVLTDTDLHVQYFHQTFGISPGKIVAVPVGARENLQTGADAGESPEEFSVLFYGSFLPLHGFEIIVEAAKQLKELPIRFDFIGGNRLNIQKLHHLCRQYGVTRYSHRGWVEPDELFAEVIPAADLCLGGPFGDTPQSRRVITGKTSQCLALGKVTVIGEIALEVGFKDKVNCLLVPQGNPDVLASQIRWAYLNRAQNKSIGAAGKALYENRLSIQCIKDHMRQLLLGRALPSP